METRLTFELMLVIRSERVGCCITARLYTCRSRRCSVAARFGVPMTPSSPSAAPLAPPVLEQVFRAPRPHNELGGDVSDDTLRQLYDLLKWGPTTANSCPARFVFVKSAEAKAKLGPALDEGNRDKTMAAPGTAIVAYAMAFFTKMAYLFPPGEATSWFDGKPEATLETIPLRNSSLEGAYLIL